MSAKMDATIDLIRRYYAAFNAGDMKTFESLLTDDVIHDINQGQREIGKDAFREFMDRMNGAYRENLTDMSIMASADGTRASAEFVVNGEYLRSDEGLPEAHGQKYVLPAGAFFVVRDGKVARITNYYNLQDWIDQVSAVNELRYERLSGNQIASHIDDLAQLRIEIFREFPYLYQGDEDYERHYLQTYIQSPRSICTLGLRRRPAGRRDAPACRWPMKSPKSANLSSTPVTTFPRFSIAASRC